MHKFPDNEENAIALGSTLDAVASMHHCSADETASASIVRCEKEKKKTMDGKFIMAASLTTMTHKALDEKAELINLSLDSENNPVKEDNSDIEMEVTQRDDTPSGSTSMAESMKLHEWIVDNIEELNLKTEVFQDRFLNIFACMVDK
ncbi:hypothetical protein BDP27DRAFT_1435554 [Rhodocollybia butyracea]|uniref:Uncharacterized protein n=1 Tax=Rhodocollybia butyracea TaxID=206335 RepID=A0A9P5TWH8_9AGAR|nr:hypothetical protein BDP27DRAFT_1435554 [Rhodocollybia butyracea]